MGKARNNFNSIEDLFIVVCLYFFQGRSQLLSDILGKEYGDILSDDDVDNKLVYHDKKEVKRNGLLRDCIKHIFLYRSLVHFHNMRKGESILKSQSFQSSENLSKVERADFAFKIAASDNANTRSQILNKLYGNRESLLTKIEDDINRFIRKTNIWQEPRGKNSSNKLLRNMFDVRGDNRIPQIINNYLIAIISYLLRGYCCFMKNRSKQNEEITWSKRSLYDFAQARYLNECLYYLLNEKNILRNDIQEIYDFRDIWASKHDAARLFQSTLENKKYNYIMYWLSIYIDILPGNVYYKLYDYEGALDYYCRAIRKYKAIPDFKIIDKELINMCNKQTCDFVSEHLSIKIRELTCRTIAKVYLEKAKCYFEKGHFLDSLKWYIKSSMKLILLCASKRTDEDSRQETIRLYCDLQKVVDYLDYEKDQSKFTRSHIRGFFEKKKDRDKYFKDCNRLINKDANQLLASEVSKEKAFLNDHHKFSEENVISPERFKAIVLMEYRHIVADILVRIGFLLYTLREHVITIEGYDDSSTTMLKSWKRLLRERNERYIFAFFKPEDIWAGFENSFASYCKLIFLKENESRKFEPNEKFMNDWERLFAGLVFSEFQSKIRQLESKRSQYLPIDPKEAISAYLGRSSMVNIDNIITLPKMLYCYFQGEGYKKRAQEYRRVKSGGIINKFVVLRRWQSFNPKIPRPRYKRVLGGGYFLIWNGKGIVIDPGYNFIENFYGQGFSLEDIDAVIITHSHPDHDDELSTILTLLHEWNEISRKNLSYKMEGRLKHLDLFLNEGCYRKYSSWLYAPNTVVRKIYQLQSNTWDIESNDPNKERRVRGKNIVIDLTTKKDGYSLKIEVIPAWHNEIIAKHSSVGLKFELYDSELKKHIRIGITGDTNAYDGIAANYKDCDILVAHLGDIKFREVRTLSKIDIQHGKLQDYFFANNYTKDNLKRLVAFLTQLDLVDIEKILKNEEDIDALFKAVWDDEYIQIDKSRISRIVETLLKSIQDHYLYENHLGITGLYELHHQMCTYRNSKKNLRNCTPLFIIGEIPEELGSHRQVIAKILNNIEYNKQDTERNVKSDIYPSKLVRCITGDIGLHIGLGIKRHVSTLKELGITNTTDTTLMIRCYQCNQNNEFVEHKLHYHPVEAIQETALKREDNSMVYLCTTFNHSSSPLFKHDFFLSKIQEA